MKIIFENIPVESKFAVFNKGNKGSSKVWVIEPGSSELEAQIPQEWDLPYRNIRTIGYWIPDAYIPINKNDTEIIVTGADYYIDVDREAMNEELNQRSIETLIHVIHGNKHINSRQKFFISLVSLQSYFEHLVYGMLIQSGHISKTRFKDLQTHARRTPIAFSVDNTDFFSNNIEICPGKENLGATLLDDVKDELKNIFDKIRTLRNKVVHKWGYKDISQQEIKDTFALVGENIDLNDSDDIFYKNAAFIFVSLYARANPLNNQLSYFNEKEMVETERKARGY